MCCIFLDYEAVVKLSDGFNGADLRNVCTEAGMLLYCFISLGIILLKIILLAITFDTGIL